MTVKELTEKLKQLPEEATVKTWDPCNDVETEEVYVSTDEKGTVWIMNDTIGYKPLQWPNDEAHLPRFDAELGELGNPAIKLYTLKIETFVSGQCAAFGQHNNFGTSR